MNDLIEEKDKLWWKKRRKKSSAAGVRTHDTRRCNINITSRRIKHLVSY